MKQTGDVNSTSRQAKVGRIDDGDEAAAASAEKSRASREAKRTAPDGGWGWMVVLGAFVHGLVAAGFTSLISVLYVEWIGYFNVSASELSWIGFLFPGMAGFVSIVIGKVWLILGVRKTAVIGAVLSAAGCLGSSFSTRPTHIALSLGVVAGLGVGLCYISSVNMVAVYFNRRFGLANGIMFLGTSVSQIGVPPLTRWLVDWYGWRGTLQIVSALMTHSIAAAMLLRPLKPTTTRKTTTKQPTSLSLSSSASSESIESGVGGCENLGYDEREVIEMGVLLSTPVGTPVIQRRRLNVGARTAEDAGHRRHGRQDSGRQLHLKPGDGSITVHGQGANDDALKFQRSEPPLTVQDNYNQNAQSSHIGENVPVINIDHADVEVALSSEHISSSHDDTDHTETRTCGRLECGDMGKEAPSTKAPTRCNMVCSALADMFGVTLFRHEPLVILQNISSIVVMVGTFPVVAHVMAMAARRGMAETYAAALLSVLGVGGTIGRMLAGVIVDKQYIGPHCFMMVVNLLTAVPIVVITFVIPDFSRTAVTVLFTGVGVGASIVLRLVQAKKVVSDPVYISDAVRIVIMTTGVGMTIGAVLSGWLADITGSYSTSFYFTADVLLFGAAINLLLSILNRRRRETLNSIRESKS